ncbi:MAG TPA: hypothetical protein VFC00_28170 [Micromonosporaceae bacterium]|nr:hypothetical protein [Micromonosporaceae bacterium]
MAVDKRGLIAKASTVEPPSSESTGTAFKVARSPVRRKEISAKLDG